MASTVCIHIPNVIKISPNG